MTQYPVHVAFPGRLIFVGFGSIGQGVLPLILRHVGIKPDQITIVTADEAGEKVAAEYGVRFVKHPLTRENFKSVLDPLVGRGDFLLNLSVDVSSIALIQLCWEKGALYLDTCIEPWPGGYTDPTISPAKRTNYALRESALALRETMKRAPTAVLTHGANPGLVSHFVKQALLDIATDTGVEHGDPGSRDDWARLAQKLGAGCVTDVNALVVEGDDLVAGRYAFGGATVAREKVTTPVKVFAVMPKTFSAEGATAGAGAVQTPSLTVESRVKVVDKRAKEGDHVNLDAAPLIVGVGRGFNAREDLALGDELAGALGAVVGCTKSLADFEWLGEDRIIGLSGAKTAPDLYLSVGISGQVQHTVGVSSAKLIAAINKDKDAPIFKLADYGIVGDLFEVVPRLTEEVKKARAGS